MRPRLIFSLAFVSVGIALLLAALLFTGGSVVPVQAQTVGTPTPDRLAQPTLPAVPSQADIGAQVYWLRCMTCHGDRGQGLTDEFRQTYPPDHQNCWTSKCHGDHPYTDGFTLPKVVPEVIGPNALQKFTDGNALHGFIAAAMPFWNPGSLSEEDGWSVTAYLLRQNGLWNGKGELSSANAGQISVGPPQPDASPTPLLAPVSAEAASSSAYALIIGGVVLIGVLLFLARFLRRTSPPEG